MIVILCDGIWQMADAYDCFVDYLKHYEPWSIKRTINHAYRVETDDDLIYTFIDRHYISLFEHLEPDILEDWEFFDGIERYYKQFEQPELYI